MSEEQCGLLPSYVNIEKGVTVSCWDISDEEMDELLLNRKIYITVLQVPPCPFMVQAVSPLVPKKITKDGLSIIQPGKLKSKDKPKKKL